MKLKKEKTTGEASKIRNSNTSKKLDFNKMKLATKTSVVMATILTALLAVLIVTSVLSVSKAMTRSVNSEFAEIAKQNGIIVQNILDGAANIAESYQDYLGNTYAEYEKNLAAQPNDGTSSATQTVNANTVMKKSQVYDADFIEGGYEAEDFILNTAWSGLKTNEDLIGIGVFFEPYAFDANLRDYAPYVDKSNVDNRTAQRYGTHAEYSKEEYYKTAAESQVPYFTNPFDIDGTIMITAAFPIVHKGETRGVAMSDIAIENFSKLTSTSENYPTMYAEVASGDGIIHL